MEKFIQRLLCCNNILEIPENIVNRFPIIRININGEERNMLLFKFQRQFLPNYVVIGIFKEENRIEKNSFIKWLNTIYKLIMYDLNKKGITKEYLELKESFNISQYYHELLFTQEGYDIISGKQYFTNAGLISRTIEVSLTMDENKEIIFNNEIRLNEFNKYLDGPFFREYKDYDENYFLNYQEYKTIPYDNALAFARVNASRLSRNTNDEWLIKMQDNLDIMQLLDVIITRGQSDPRSKTK